MKKLSVFIAVIMLFTMLPIASMADEVTETKDIVDTSYFRETFGEPAAVGEQALSTSTSAGYGNWRLAADNLSTANEEGTKLDIKKESETNNVFHLVRTDAYNADTAQLEVGQDLSGIPTTGKVELSFRMYRNVTGYNIMVRGIFGALRRDWHSLTDGTKFTPVGAAQETILLDTETWHTYRLIIDYDKTTTTLYVDELQIGDVANVAPKITHIGFLMPRNAAGGDIYIDDINISQKSSPTLLAFNPATKGSIYVDKDLATSITLDGASYPITYETSDSSVINSNGKVTIPDFFSTVTVTPVITVDGVELRGTATQLTVLPKNYQTRLDSDFNNLVVATEASGDAATGTNVEAGDLFDANGDAYDTTENAWHLANSWKANYRTEYPSGERIQVVNDGNEKVLRMNKIKGSSPYNKDLRLEKAIPNPACGDRVALSMRIKVVSGSMNLSSYFMGRLRSAGLRADFANLLRSNDLDYTISAGWHTYLFVYDSALTETQTQGTTSYENAHPISLYIDGEYKGTGWTTENNFKANSTDFQLMQWDTVGTSEVYVDDILLVNFDAEDVQFTGATVDGGKITNVGLQYASYGQTAISGTVFAGAYDAQGKLIQVGVLGTATAATAGFTNADVTDYTLPEGTASYRLFLFDSVETLKPLAVSKTIALQ